MPNQPGPQPSGASGALRRPFAEQVAFFRLKLGKLVPTRRWDDMTGAAHDTGFMVAGAQKADLLADLAASVDRAIAEGKSLDPFRKDFAAAVDRHDWHGWTGEGSKGGEAWRTRVIYRANTYVAYAAGRRAQLEASDWKFWIYVHGGSEEPRPEHLNVFNGLILPPDHPFWVKHYPPSDWGCSCYVLGANTLAQAKRLGGIEGKTLPDGWDAPDPATGEPMGVGKGWGYAPGASVAPEVSAIAGKIGSWDYQIAKAFMSELPTAAADAIAAAFQRLPSVADDTRRYARRILGEGGDGGARIEPIRTFGLATADQRVAIAAAKPDLHDLSGFDFSLKPDAVDHVFRRHGRAKTEEPRGQVAVTSESYARLPALVASPDTIEDGGAIDNEPALVLTKRFPEGRYVAVFTVRKGQRTLALRTLYIRKGR